MSGNLCLLAACAYFVVPGALGDKRSLEERVTAGECTSSSLEEGGTFFPPERQVKKMQETGADFFEVFYSTTFKVVVSKLVKEHYVLTQCGLEKPSDAEVEKLVPLEAGYQRKHFDVPLQSVLSEETVHLGFLNELGVDDRTDFLSKYATEPCWQKAIGCGAAVSGNATIKEQQIEQVDAIFAAAATVNGLPKGIHIPITEDPSPLKSAEYIKFVGVFFNKDAEASELFEKIKARYDNADPNVPDERRPVVAWISFSTIDWATGEKGFIVSKSAYKQVFVSVAGGENFDTLALADLPGLVNTSSQLVLPLAAYNNNKSNASEFLLSALADVDVVIDEVYAPVPSAYTIDTFYDTFSFASTSPVKFVQNKMVLRYDGTVSETNGLDWFESRLPKPDWAVEGLARCLHATGGTFKYFRNIATGEAPQKMTASMCKTKLPACGEGEPLAIPLLGDGKKSDSEGDNDGNVWIWVAVVAAVIAAVVGVTAYMRCGQGASGEDVEAGDVPLQSQS